MIIPLFDGENINFEGQLVSAVSAGQGEFEYTSGENFLKTKRFIQKDEIFQIAGKNLLFLAFSWIISDYFTFHLILKKSSYLFNCII